MSRKYRQRGYMDDEKPEKSRRPQKQRLTEGPRSPRMTAFQEVFRCAVCGSTLPPSFDDITVASQCPKCGNDLHSCKNCVYFDPASRFECSQTIPERVSPKDTRNACEYFEARTTVEKETSSSGPKEPLDPRQMFERLFKK